MIDYACFAIIILCIVLSAFFSGSEIALVSMNHANVRALVDAKVKGSKALAKLKEKTDHLLITILVGNNIVNISLASLATAMAISVYGDVGVGIATGVVTIVTIIFGEILPKTYAAKHAEKISLFSARFILILNYILTPFLYIYDLLGSMFKKHDEPNQPAVTEEEIKQWIDVGEESGTIEEDEHKMLFRVFRFTDTIVREAMTPRIDVRMIEDNMSLNAAVEIFNETGFSRIPVYHDLTDNIIGVINIKDVFSAIVGKKPIKVIDLAHEPLFVPETKKIDDLLTELRKEKTHLAVVVDEYGAFAGVITMEDILEELVGEIMDEFDEEVPQIQEIEKGVYLINASARVSNINESLKVSLPLNDLYESIGGLIITVLGHIPKRGEIIRLENGIELHVMKMRGRKIIDVMVKLPKSESDTNLVNESENNSDS